MYFGWSNKFYKSKKYGINVIIAFLVLTMPFLNFWHLLFNPDYSSMISIFGLEFEHGFASNEVFAWHCAKELIVLGLYIIWFFTSRHKWKYGLILLISFSIYNILYLLNVAGTVEYIIIAIVISLCIFDFFILGEFRKNRMEVSISDFLLANMTKSNFNRFNSEVSAIIDQDEKRENIDEINKIFYLKSILGNLLKDKNQTDYSIKRTSILNWVFGFTLLVCFALLFLHHLIPETLDEIDLGFVRINNHGFQSVDLFVWFQMRKLVMIITLIVWFITCDEWWKYAILSPIILYTFQFWEAFQDQQYLDAAGNLTVAPIILMVIFIVLILSRTIKYRLGLLEIYDYLTQEVDKTFKQLNSENPTVSESLIKYGNLKRKISSSSNSKEHLKNLIDFREKLRVKAEYKN